jgi:hypothetical protein
MRRSLATGNDEQLRGAATPGLRLRSVSHDGEYLIYDELSAPDTGSNVGMLRMAQPDALVPLVRTAFDESAGAISPDGRWLAYSSDDAGRSEVFIQPLQGGRRVQVSTVGGRHPRWRGDGRELFYLAPDGGLMALSVSVAPALALGTPALLFRVALASQQWGGNQYDVTRDGQRFIINVDETGGETAPIAVILDWASALRN